MKRLAAFLVAFVLATATWAVEPGEVLDDPILEDRARTISKSLRCLQCRNEAIDESNADIARDLRLLVRERLVAGDTDTEVVDYVVARYGEYVLLRPNGRGANLVLWLAGPVLLILTLLGLWLVQRGATRPDPNRQGLSSSEEAALQSLLGPTDQRTTDRNEL